MGWVTSNFKRLRRPSKRFKIGLILGGVVALFDLQSHLDAGIPYGNDMLSNFAPALYFRHAVVSGSDFLTTPWYGGMALWENSFFKGFYPPWTVFYIPGIPIDLWLAIMKTGHLVGAGVAAYYFARRELHPRYAVPIAVIVALPATAFNGHISKTLAWPWMVIGLWQLRPVVIAEQPRTAGRLVGIAGGAMILIANAYYALYLALLAGCIFLALRAWKAIQAAAILSVVVGSPKLLLLLPSLLDGGRDTILGEGIAIQTLGESLIGFWPSSGFIVWQEAYAVVSISICLLAGGGFLWAYIQPERFPVRWMLGCLAAVLIGLLIVTASPLVYRWPGMTMFRVPDRAVLIIGAAFLLVAVETIQVLHQTSWGDQQWVNYALTGLLVIGLLTAAMPPALQNTTLEEGTVPTVGQDVAASLNAHGCQPVWVEINAVWDSDDKDAGHHQQITYGLAERGVPAVATYYAKIGQNYSTHDKNGELTFEALVLQGGAQLPPNQTVTLTGGWFQPDRGQIETSQFAVVDQVSTPRGPARIYAVNGTC